jgi:hypothetical protein
MDMQQKLEQLVVKFYNGNVLKFLMMERAPHVKSEIVESRCTEKRIFCISPWGDEIVLSHRTSTHIQSLKYHCTKRYNLDNVADILELGDLKKTSLP